MTERDPSDAAINDALNELEEEGAIDTEYERGEEPKHALTEDGVAGAEQLIQESVGAQLMLLDLHWSRVCVEADTTKQALDELFRFVAYARDELGVNLLRTLAEKRDRLGQDRLPDFTEATLEKFDP